MAFEVFRSAESNSDLDAILDHLLRAYQLRGHDFGEAIRDAGLRLDRILDDISALRNAPHQGTIWTGSETAYQIRWVTKGRAILYFRIDEGQRRIDILAIYFGGQDHKELMHQRLLGIG